jgi:hypothetical protein
MQKWLRFGLFSLAGLVVIAAPLPAFSQSCALCYTQAASATQQFIQALRSGILILVVPPSLMWTAALVVVYRRRNKFRVIDETNESFSSW